MCVSQKELLDFHKYNELPKVAIKKRNMHKLISNFFLVNAEYFVLTRHNAHEILQNHFFPYHVSEDKFALILSVRNSSKMRHDSPRNPKAPNMNFSKGIWSQFHIQHFFLTGLFGAYKSINLLLHLMWGVVSSCILNQLVIAENVRATSSILIKIFS